MTNNSAVSSKIRPAIYNDFDTEGRQWIENYLDNSGYTALTQKAIVLALGDKYLDRLGGKDEEEQELKKACWYYRFSLDRFPEDARPADLSQHVFNCLDRPQYKTTLQRRAAAHAIHIASRDDRAYPRLVTATYLLHLYENEALSQVLEV